MSDHDAYTDTLDGLHLYVQPGGCVEISQLHDEQPDDEEPEMVHLCHWDDLVTKVEAIRARRRIDGTAL